MADQVSTTPESQAELHAAVQELLSSAQNLSSASSSPPDSVLLMSESGSPNRDKASTPAPQVQDLFQQLLKLSVVDLELIVASLPKIARPDSSIKPATSERQAAAESQADVQSLATSVERRLEQPVREVEKIIPVLAPALELEGAPGGQTFIARLELALVANPSIKLTPAGKIAAAELDSQGFDVMPLVLLQSTPTRLISHRGNMELLPGDKANVARYSADVGAEFVQAVNVILSK